jgi:hypothetical protein
MPVTLARLLVLVFAFSYGVRLASRLDIATAARR